MMKNLSFVTVLAYDYKYAFDAIKRYYDFADEIFLGLDKEHISWSGKRFCINERGINNFIRKIDVHNKVRIIKGNFHSSKAPMENDTFERNFLSLKCKPDNWIIQIDSDELMLNPKEFADWLQKAPRGFTVKANWITVFKRFDGTDDCLIIDSGEETFVGTKKPNSYIICRETKEESLSSPLKILHFSFGRTRGEVKQKLANWSHSKDFDVKAYFKFWDEVTLDNYRQFKSIHPIWKDVWPKLKVANINELLKDG